MATTVTIIASLLAALISLFVSCAKFVDWRRQKHVPVHLTSRTYYGSAEPGAICTAERTAPLFAVNAKEKVARFADLAEHMKTGDILTFSGRSLWSYLLRIGTYSDKSHCGMVVRDDEGLWIVDSCEGLNVSKRYLFDEVQKYPGQWYWHAIRHEFERNYHRKRAAEAFMAMIANGTKYGWIGIILQYMIRTPVLRIFAYWLRLDQLPFYKNRPYCSHALKDVMRIGSLDPVPGRPGQLTTPQDINQSLAGVAGVAIVT